MQDARTLFEAFAKASPSRRQEIDADGKTTYRPFTWEEIDEADRAAWVVVADTASEQAHKDYYEAGK